MRHPCSPVLTTWLCLGALAIGALPGVAQRTGGISGQLLDRVSRVPLADASVSLVGSTVVLRANELGRFAMELVPGSYVMQARAPGYTPGSWVVQVAEHETLTVVIELDAAQGVGTVAAQLLDRTSRAPIPSASVRLLGSASDLRSDAAGRLVIGLVAGVYVMQARALGYAPSSRVVEVAPHETLTVVLELDVAPVPLPGVTVEGQRWEQRGLAGFETRRRGGRGIYLSEGDIRHAQAGQLSDLLRSVAGVRVICRFGRCRVRMTRGDCQPDYFLDGYPANNSTSPEMPLIGVIAVEIYRTITETPVEFLRSSNTCGTIVLWTRSGPS